MICPQCRAQGLKSQVVTGAGTGTLVHCPPFYDEEGRYHVHDTNTGAQAYSCSNGHSWRESTGPAPCWCGWPEKSEESPVAAEEAV